MTPTNLRAAADLYDKYNEQIDNYKKLKVLLNNISDLIEVSHGYGYTFLPPDVILKAHKREIEDIHNQLTILGIPNYELTPVYEL